MRYIIVNRRGIPYNRLDRLSPTVIRYSSKCYSTFPTPEEAQRHLNYIRGEVRTSEALTLRITAE